MNKKRKENKKKTYTNQQKTINQIYLMLKNAGIQDVIVRLASDGFRIHVCGRNYKSSATAMRAAKRIIANAYTQGEAQPPAK